jgi:hypothetical protein
MVMRKKIRDLRKFPMTTLSAQLKAMSDADVVELLINDVRPTADAAYQSRLGRELYLAVVNRKECQELELPDGTSVVFVA